MTDVQQFLMQSGVKSFAFEKVGDTAKGVIESLEMQQQRGFTDGEPLWWDDEKTQPKKQLRIVLKTDAHDDDDDDGRRAIYVKSFMQQAVRDAIRAAGAEKIEEGGTLAVRFDSEGEPPKKGLNPPKYYRAQYQPPTITPAAVAVDDLI